MSNDNIITVDDIMASATYIVHGLDCTEGKPKTNVVNSFADAVRDLESWFGWYSWYKDTRNLGGSENDFYIEKKIV